MSEAERAKIRGQLNRMLETHHFKNSKRYPALLRFIVEEALENRGDHLKERLLGVRVFDRPANYDTAADPIVRVTIAEIRKRIAQYYHDEEHDEEIRIELLPGRYAPEFRLRRETGTPHRTADEIIDPVKTSALLIERSEQGTRSHRVLGYGAALLFSFVVVFGSMALLRWAHASALDEMWSPILITQRSVLFCLPTDVARKRLPSGEPIVNVQGVATGEESFLDFESLGQNVVYSDMLAAMQVANIMATHHRDYRVKLSVGTTLEDLRLSPAVLIGALDNPWTMRALAPLRYHFIGSDEDRYWIVDNENPANRDWSLDLKVQYAAVTRDYAIVARVHNEQTQQMEMIVAGIGMSGTAAAGNFITEKSRMEELKQRIGPGFKDHDFEVVLSTDVVNGIPGAPKIVAVSVR